MPCLATSPTTPPSSKTCRSAGRGAREPGLGSGPAGGRGWAWSSLALLWLRAASAPECPGLPYAQPTIPPALAAPWLTPVPAGPYFPAFLPGRRQDRVRQGPRRPRVPAGSQRQLRRGPTSPWLPTKSASDAWPLPGPKLLQSRCPSRRGRGGIWCWDSVGCCRCCQDRDGGGAANFVCACCFSERVCLSLAGTYDEDRTVTPLAKLAAGTCKQGRAVGAYGGRMWWAKGGPRRSICTASYAPLPGQKRVTCRRRRG